MTKISSVSLSLALAIAGCASVHESTTSSSEVIVPVAYDTNVQTSENLPELGPWWTNFGDEALNALVTAALDQNRSLEAGIANVVSARAAVTVADAKSLPSISGSASTSVSSDAGLDEISRSARLSASYELDLFGV
ncbi:MAG TPA: RND transporter, partial [Hyphomonas atlantica]|nr:RND transporter [Hyphomonas atlantica]